MPLFPRKPGAKSTVYQLKTPFPDITAFDAVVRDLVLHNRLACVPYRNRRKDHRPVEKVREMYTAKFTYTDAKGKIIGRTSEVYDSVEGYESGISAVIANIANREAHRGKVKRLPSADLFSVILKCHDPGGELYFLHIARDRFTIASYADEAIRRRVEDWAVDIPAIA
jgi:hypothetical protein